MVQLIAGAVLLLANTGLVAAGAGCNADNCLRAMRANSVAGRLESAREFCASYTGTAAGVPIPSYAADSCKGDAARISSACSCIGSATKTSSSTSSTLTTSVRPTSGSKTSSTADTTSTTTSTITSTVTNTSSPTVEPCAEVSASVSSATAASARPTVAANLAYKCLKSVPITKSDALKLVDSVKPYFEWQSDVEWLKNPPSDYYYPPYDLFKELARVRDNVQNDKYDNEYDFQVDLMKSTAMAAHDGHFAFIPDLLGAGIYFIRGVGLVSVSDDGKSLPVIRQAVDIVRGVDDGITIQKINNVDAAKYIEKDVAGWQGLQDIDAAYNTMFYSLGNENANQYSSRGLSGFYYDGDNTTYGLGNGRTVVQPNTAFVSANFDGVTDGKSFYKKFCSGASQGSGSGAGAENNRKADAAAVQPKARNGYPKPVVRTTDAITAGYFLDGEGVGDVAVLSILSFGGNRPESLAVIKDFFARAQKAGRTKLVLDLQGNPGGEIMQGYDLFGALFPDTRGDAVGVFRENPSFNAITAFLKDDGDGTVAPFDWRTDLDVDFKNFTSYEGKFGPKTVMGGDFTNILRWDTQKYGVAGVDANGTAPFAPEDIVLLYDGYCASTCTILSQMLKQQKGIKSVAFGGRPSTSAIQGVGGVKGANIYQFALINYYATQIKNITSDPKIQAGLANVNDYAMRRSKYASINVRNALLKPNYDDYLPSQFVVEESDCRLYWTREMIRSTTPIWTAAATAAYLNGPCISGGIKYKGKPNRRPASGGSDGGGPETLSGDFTIPPLPKDYWVNYYQQMVEPNQVDVPLDQNTLSS